MSHSVPSDCRRSRIGRTALAVLLSAVAILAAFHWDDTVDGWIRAHQTEQGRHVAGAISFYGDWPWLMGVGALGLGLARTRMRQRWVRIVRVMMISSSLAGIAVNTVRLTAGRTRPNAPIAQGWYGIRYQGRWLIGVNRLNSFPSGHTATAVGFAVPLLFVAPEAGVPMLAVALTIAGSRVYLRAHHLSDITTAAVVATWLAAAITRRWGGSEV